MKRTAVLFLCVFFLWSPALSEVILPGSLREIREEAFRGDRSIDSVWIPEGVAAIGARAFADTGLMEAVIPSSVRSIARNAFENVSAPLLIRTSAGSAAVEFAIENNIDFRADTVCRALLIAQSDYPGSYKLNGPAKDVLTIRNVLTDYAVTTRINLTGDEILDAIAETFEGAKQEDISLFYYSGHGRITDGSLIGIDIHSYATADQIRSAMDKIPGKKIILVDACYSGALIGKSLPADETEEFTRNFLSAFELMACSTLASSPYFVIASSTGREKSWESGSGGLFTNAFAKSRTAGDANGDGVVTFQEAYAFTGKEVAKIAAAAGVAQTVQVYPEDCRWFGMFR